jgi:hypothetical protein
VHQSLLTNDHAYTILLTLCVTPFARHSDAETHVFESCGRALGAHAVHADALSRFRKNAGLSEGNHGFGKPPNRRGKSEGKMRAESCWFFRGFRENTLPAIPRGSVFRGSDSPQTPLFPREMAISAIPVVRDGKVRERYGDGLGLGAGDERGGFRRLCAIRKDGAAARAKGSRACALKVPIRQTKVLVFPSDIGSDGHTCFRNRAVSAGRNRRCHRRLYN